MHAYTSPHLARFYERIRLAGELIAEERLLAELERCEAANGGRPITFFEITTAAAFNAMAETPADWCLLEVGLGGRLDATNVIARPRLTAITPVSLDHQHYLGESLAEIAFEKAGILKRGVACVLGPQGPEALDAILEQAAAVGAPLIAEGQDWQVWEEHGRMAFQDGGGLLDLPLPNLIGAHQVANAGIALAALRHLGLGEAACVAAVTRAEWPARLQRLRRGPLVAAAGRAELWLDGGHNPAAGAALAEAVGRLPARPLHLVAGMLRTKDAAGFFRPLARGGRGRGRGHDPRRGRDAARRGDRRRRPRGRPRGGAGREPRGRGGAHRRPRALGPHPDLRLALSRGAGAARERVIARASARVRTRYARHYLFVITRYYEKCQPNLHLC